MLRTHVRIVILQIKLLIMVKSQATVDSEYIDSGKKNRQETGQLIF